MGAVFLGACFGGQTGEITELTACHEPVGVRAVDEASPSDPTAPTAGERLDALAASAEAELAVDGGSTALFVSYAATGEPGTLLGGPECEEPWLELPVTIDVRTADGALDEAIEGVALLSGADTVSVRGSIALSALRGSLDPTALGSDVDPSRDTLDVELSSGADALTGRIALRVGEPDPTDRELTAF